MKTTNLLPCFSRVWPIILIYISYKFDDATGGLWVLHLAQCFQGSLKVVTYQSFISFVVEQYFIVWIYRNLAVFTFSQTDIVLLWTSMYRFVWISLFNSFGWISCSEMTVSYNNSIFKFGGKSECFLQCDSFLIPHFHSSGFFLSP